MKLFSGYTVFHFNYVYLEEMPVLVDEAERLVSEKLVDVAIEVKDIKWLLYAACNVERGKSMNENSGFQRTRASHYLFARSHVCESRYLCHFNHNVYNVSCETWHSHSSVLTNIQTCAGGGECSFLD